MTALRTPVIFPDLSKTTAMLVRQEIFEKQPHNVFAKQTLSPIKEALLSGNHVEIMKIKK